MVSKPSATEVFLDELHEDELSLLMDAIADARKRGFGEITLCFKNGYVYTVKESFQRHNENNNHRG